MASYEIPSFSVISPIGATGYALSPPPPPPSLYVVYAYPPQPTPSLASPPAPLPTPPLEACPPHVAPPPKVPAVPHPTETSPPSPVSNEYPPPAFSPLSTDSTPPPLPTLSPPPPYIAPSSSLSLPLSPPAASPSTNSPPISFIYSSPPPPPPFVEPPRSSPPPPFVEPPRSSPPPLSSHPPPSLPPPSPLVEPPTSSVAPPPSVEPPSSLAPPPVLQSPSESQTAPSSSPLPPPPSHSSNSSSGIAQSSPPLRSPTAPSVPFYKYPNSSSDTPFTPNAASASDYSRNDAKGLGRSSSTKNSGITTENVATIAVVTCFFMLTFVGAAMLFVKKRRAMHAPGGYAGGFDLPPRFGSPQITVSSHPRSASVPLVRYSSGSSRFTNSVSELGLGNSKFWFMYEELSTITNGFSSQNLLGEGGFGFVFKGCLHDGREVAVKQLKVGGAQGEREFRAEVEIISRVHHRHLVSLVGYCISEEHRLLVYDYVPNNTLYFHIHGNGQPALDWATRVKVAAGAARGIAYLHEDCHPRIIHRDIKSSNILLDNDFEAQVSDFGLARSTRDACTHVSTRVMGTFGYMAPEYASTGKLTAKSDVYSFGVVLLELVTGRKPVDTSQPLGEESLVEWARPLLSSALQNRDFGALPDPRLENNYKESEMFRIVEAAAACVRHSVVMRPRMGQVVRALDNLRDLDINNGVKPGQSELFASGPQTEEIIRFQRRSFGSEDYGSDFSRARRTSRTYL